MANEIIKSITVPDAEGAENTYDINAYNSDELEGLSVDEITFKQRALYLDGAPIRLTGFINALATNDYNDSVDATNLYSHAYLSRIGNTTVGYVDEIKDATMKNQVVYYVAGPSTDTTAGTWTGTIPGITAYYDGLSVLYVPAIAGASTTTLNINGLGAKTCYYTNSSKLTTHYAVGTPILLTYVGGYWKRADYNADSDVKVRQYLTTAGSYPLLAMYDTVGTTTEGYQNDYSRFTNDIYIIADTEEPTIVAPGGDFETVETENLIVNNGPTINGVKFDGYTNIGFFAVDNTNDPETGARTATCSNFVLTNNTIIFYKKGTIYGAVADSNSTYATLNINNTGAKQLVDAINGTLMTPSDLAKMTGILILNYSSSQYNVLYSATSATSETNGLMTSGQVQALNSLSANSGVTAGSYGPSENATPTHGGTFSVPYITTNANGRLTAASTKTITLPTYSAATTSANGLMSSTDKTKLDGIATGATANIGTITQVSGGNGLTGSATSGAVTLNVGAGTGITVSADAVSAKLKSTTALNYASTNAAYVSGRLYSVVTDNSGYLSVVVPWTKTNVSVNQALTSGTNIGSITIDGTTTQLYAPMAGEAVTYDVFTGSTSSTAGTTGLVPGPSASASYRYLCSDGTWADYIYFEDSVNSDNCVSLGGCFEDTDFHYLYLAGRDSFNTYIRSELKPEKLILNTDYPSTILEESKLSLGYSIDISSNTEAKGIVLDATQAASEGDSTIILTKYWRSGSGTTLVNNIDSQLTITPTSINFNDNRGTDDFVLTRTSVSGNDTALLSWQNWLGIQEMGGATSSAAGETGMVPAPAAGAQSKFLRGDGTWQTPSNTKVTQTVRTTNAEFPILLRGTSAGTTTTTTTTSFGTGVTINPYTQTITANALKASDVYADYFIAEDTNGTSYTMLDLGGLQITDTTNDICLTSSGGLEYYTGNTVNFKIDATGNPSGTDTIKSSWKTWLGIDTIESQLSTLVDANEVSY